MQQREVMGQRRTESLRLGLRHRAEERRHLPAVRLLERQRALDALAEVHEDAGRASVGERRVVARERSPQRGEPRLVLEARQSRLVGVSPGRAHGAGFCTGSGGSVEAGCMERKAASTRSISSP
ncbi:MAG TPA: hypothetical protein DEF51_46705 [Myxococcales bacterium]|nr:hypothetical protein [Myxococcales bacterium]